MDSAEVLSIIVFIFCAILEGFVLAYMIRWLKLVFMPASKDKTDYFGRSLTILLIVFSSSWFGELILNIILSLTLPKTEVFYGLGEIF